MSNKVKLPILPLRDPELVVFPGLFCEVDVGRAFSLNAVSSSGKDHSDSIIMAMQQDSSVDDPKAKDFFAICTEAEIKSVLPLDKDATRIRVILKGTRRAILETVGTKGSGDNSYLYGTVEIIELENSDINEEVKDTARQLKEMVTEHLQFVTIEEDSTPTDRQSLSDFVDNVAGQLPIPGKRRLYFLKLKDPAARLKEVRDEVADLCRQSELEFDAGSEEGDDVDDPGQIAISEVKKLQKKVHDAGMPEHALKVARAELRRLSMMPPNGSEFQVTYNYVDHLASLPWDKTTEDNLDIDVAEKSLNDDHYGLEKPKERILEYLSVRKLLPSGKGPILCFSGPPGVGKAQPLDAKVLTPWGYEEMQNIDIGTSVCTPSGEVATVIGIFPQGELDIYKVKFSDGTSTECCDEHLWYTKTKLDRGSKRFGSVKSLRDIKLSLKYGADGQRNHSIPTINKIDLKHCKERPIDPYVMGVLLGDGHLGSAPLLSSADEEIVNFVKRELSKMGCGLIRRSKYDFRIVKQSHNPSDNMHKTDNRSTVVQALEYLELLGTLSYNKFVPEQYKAASFQDRLSILQGLLDSDGSPHTKNASVEFCSSSRQLAEDVKFLAESLGSIVSNIGEGDTSYVYNGDKKQGVKRYRVNINPPPGLVPFRLHRKIKLYENKNKRTMSRYIDDIIYVGKKQAKCILIDHPDHLYITNNFIVTHNTSLGKSIAKAMGREFVRFSLGGVNDEAEIRGHRRTYVGAIPGRIIQYIQKIGTRNPVFMLDEVDKICSNFRGDPSSALLEMLDPEQNHSFVDHYLGVPFDLSQVLFIGTVNETTPLTPALKDRMEIIDLPGYSPFDKVKIAQGHLIKKQKEENGLKEVGVNVSANAIGRIVDEYTSEAGVRSLERECGTIMRKIAVMVASEKEYPSLIKIDMIPKFLGPPKVFAEKAMEKPEIGLGAGLAWSRNGGSLLFVETSLTPGEGKIKLTGNLGKVIQESADAAYTWIKSNAERLNVDSDRLSKYDVHIHFPAGAVPKEGPSAGIAIAASMLSLILDKPVRNDVAMTGEITLRGRILPIGGLKEKILAAHRAGIKEVLYPAHNKHDVTEIPSDVANDMTLTPVSSLDEALEMVILDETVGEESPNDMNPGDGELLMNMEA
jgi:ATP-dependent Lon protease